MFEVLKRERTKNVSGLLQLAGILVGFASMLMIEIFGEFISLISDYYFLNFSSIVKLTMSMSMNQREREMLSPLSVETCLLCVWS